MAATANLDELLGQKTRLFFLSLLFFFYCSNLTLIYVCVVRIVMSESQ